LIKIEYEKYIPGFGCKREGKILIGKSEHRLKFSSEMELKPIEWSGMD
jgi:hypothetical protein